MNLLYKHLLAAKKNPLTSYKRLISSFVFSLLALSSWSQTAQAEGSRTIYPSGNPGFRANIEWRTSDYGGIVRRRTLLRVFAKQDEYILMGSSAVKVNNGNILIFNPGSVTGSIGSENVPIGSEAFNCSAQSGANTGKITSRTQELAGPRSVDGTGNTTGYIPCVYRAPVTGVYEVVFLGPDGANSNNEIQPTGEINLTSSSNFDGAQSTNVAAWDVTVRNSTSATTDITGRLFTYYIAFFTGFNGRPVYFPIYPVTTDGFRYRVSLRGTDPNGFILYGNQVGFFNSDGQTPLYRSVNSNNNQLLPQPDGGVSLSSPQYPTFFNPLDPEALPFINRYRPDGTLDGVGIPLEAIIPEVSDLRFQGTVGGNNSSFTTGGSFFFNSNVTGNYQLIISRDGSNFDPTNPNNRVLRGIMTITGLQSIPWNGRDNSGNFFPVGNNYPFVVTSNAGEYHFPLLDAENNFEGGPTIEMLNAGNPLGNFTAFYDDRNYTTFNGTSVTIQCGIGQTNPRFSDTLNGFDSRNNDRRFGQSSGGNAGSRCNGSFGDTKGLDMWTYYRSNSISSFLNIVNYNATLLLVKRITQINGQDITDIVDGRSDVPTTANNYAIAPRDADDNDPDWPSNYLRGRINAGVVINPGEELEYTIYFLSTGQAAARNIQFCDLIPINSTFVPTSFNGLSPNDGGLPGADQGIALAISSTAPTNYLTNVADSDRGVYYPPGDPSTPSFCGNNTNGAIVVNITSPALPELPAATSPGTPNSYGFVRFRAKVR
ncbi:MAG TPA: hypothetical protein VK184_23085 [Nostocaceae cyanobacterium]|nr:hypothetical protein [Nostocaceae cyanobacterium]